MVMIQYNDDTENHFQKEKKIIQLRNDKITDNQNQNPPLKNVITI